MKAPIATSSSSRSTIFVYGTLLSPRVVEVLLGRQHHDPSSQQQRAMVQGFQRHAVKDVFYPAMIPSNNRNGQYDTVVEGCLLSDLSPQDRTLLDWFEGDEYEATPVEATLLNNHQGEEKEEPRTIKTECYIWKPQFYNQLIPLSQKVWSFEEFQAEHLQEYLETTVRPCRQEMEQLGMTN